MDKKWLWGLAALLLIVGALDFHNTSEGKNDLDMEKLHEDAAFIEEQYHTNEGLIRDLVRGFWEDEGIEAVYGPRPGDTAAELWRDGEREDRFGEEFPQLYRIAAALLDSDFPWRSFSRDEEAENVIVCTVMSGRYGSGPYMTSFYLYVSDASIPKTEDMDYYREFSDGCVLAAKTRVLE